MINTSYTAEALTASNPIVPRGELWIESNGSNKAKLGNGVTAWNSLAYWEPSGTAYRVGQAAAMFGSGGQYWSHPIVHGTSVTVAGVAYTVPFWVPTTVVIDRIGAEVTTGAGSSTITLGIYEDNGNYLPGALLFDAGTIDGNSATAQEITISPQRLIGGRFYHTAALVAGGTPTIRVLTSAGAGWNGRQTSLANATGATLAFRNGVSQASIVGTALPTTSAATTPAGVAPCVAVRFAS